MKELVTIIAPVYNVAEFLPRFFQSVTGQTYQELEIIVVDDGSTDKSSGICKEWAKKDKRIRVFKQKNAGVAAARNKGLLEASGRYICFIDPDDFVRENYVARMLEVLKNSGAEIVQCNFQAVEPSVVPDFSAVGPERVRIYDVKEALAELLYQKVFDNSLWGKMFRAGVLKGLEFEKGYIYEDLPVVFSAFSKASKVARAEDQLYFYNVRPDSLMRAEFSEKNLGLVKFVDEMGDVVDEKYPELSDAMISRKMNACFHILRTIDRERFSEDDKLIREWIRANRSSVLHDKNVKRKTKIGILLSYINMDLPGKVFGLGIVKKKAFMK